MKTGILEKEGLLDVGKTARDAELSLNPPGKQSVPWIAKLLLGAGGWLTAIFLVGFTALLMSEILNTRENEVAGFIGVIYLAISILISRFHNQPFLTQLTLAIGTAGLALLAFGLWKTGEPKGQISVVTSAMICPLIYWISKNEILKYISIVAAFLVWWIFQMSARHEMFSSLAPIAGVIPVVLFLCGVIKTRYWRPALLGFISGLYFLLFLPMIPDRYTDTWQGYDIVSLSVMIALGFGFAVWWLSRPETTTGIVYVILFAAILFLVSCFGSAGIAASLGVIVSARARNDTSLKWIGIVGLTFFVIAFYYFLGTPLLEKSYLLLGTGVILLIATCALRFRTKKRVAES